MILSFKKQFTEKILTGLKVHSIRADPGGRWRPGMKIHFWEGNPRNVNLNPRESMVGVCTGVQDIRFENSGHDTIKTFVDGRELELSEASLLAHKDGFGSLYELHYWFTYDPREKSWLPEYRGRIIHWTDLRY